MTKKTGTTKKTTKKTKTKSRPSAAKVKPAVAKRTAALKAVAKPAPASAKSLKSVAKDASAKPAKSPFTKKEMEPYRRLLLDLRAKLIKEVLLNQEASNEKNDGEVLDLADQASDSYDKDLANSLSETERARLQAVEEALARVDDGRYGLCENCRSPIPLRRLEVLPFAKFCVECQQEEERANARRLPEA